MAVSSPDCLLRRNRIRQVRPRPAYRRVQLRECADLDGLGGSGHQAVSIFAGQEHGL